MIVPKRAFGVLLFNIFLSVEALGECSTDDNCFHFYDLASWNEEFVTSLCTNHGLTDKSMNAVLCDDEVGDVVHEDSLKLAILNTMHGTGPITTNCPHWCMWDPYNVAGDSSISFQWTNQQCWKVYVGRTSPLCHFKAVAEWEWSLEKSENWCCPADSTTDSTTNRICSTKDYCQEFQDISSWNQEYLTSLCTNDGLTDKSMDATLCDTWRGDPYYEESLKLAIVNTMYGTGGTASHCPQWCMYDPFNTFGQNAVGFKWNNKDRCWNVVLGGDNNLCHVRAFLEWESAVVKSLNWCCDSVN